MKIIINSPRTSLAISAPLIALIFNVVWCSVQSQVTNTFRFFPLNHPNFCESKEKNVRSLKIFNKFQDFNHRKYTFYRIFGQNSKRNWNLTANVAHNKNTQWRNQFGFSFLIDGSAYTSVCCYSHKHHYVFVYRQISIHFYPTYSKFNNSQWNSVCMCAFVLK